MTGSYSRYIVRYHSGVEDVIAEVHLTNSVGNTTPGEAVLQFHSLPVEALPTTDPSSSSPKFHFSITELHAVLDFLRHEKPVYVYAVGTKAFLGTEGSEPIGEEEPVAKPAPAMPPDLVFVAVDVPKKDGIHVLICNQGGTAVTKFAIQYDLSDSDNPKNPKGQHFMTGKTEYVVSLPGGPLSADPKGKNVIKVVVPYEDGVLDEFHGVSIVGSTLVITNVVPSEGKTSNNTHKFGGVVLP